MGDFGGRVAKAATATVVLLALALTALPASAEAAAPVATTEITVSLRPGAQAAQIADTAGGDVARRVPGRPDLAVLRVPRAQAAAVTAQLGSRPDVAFAAANPVARIAAATNDPLLKSQWHLQDRSSAAGSANWLPVGAADLGAGATVAILDTGVTGHSDIDGLLPGRDFIADDSDPTDPHGHGTHVAGTVAETSGNGVGAAGIAPGASVLPVRVLDESGNASYDKIFAGLAYAVEAGADVVNLSLAGSTDAGMCDAVHRTVAAGVIVVAATGNDGASVGYPAACPDAIAVGAVTMTGALASYSNSGPSVDLTAPGGESEDTNLDLAPDGILQYSVFNGKGGYYYSAGTSMASPHVAAAATIVRSIRPSATPAQVRQVLTSTATDKGSAGPDSSFGAGILDVAAVVAAANALPTAAPASPPATTAPPATPSEPATTEPATEPDSAPQPAPAPDDGAARPGSPAKNGNSPAAETADVQRLSGTDRFATAAAVSAARFGSGSAHVWLATGAGYADALSTGAAAGRLSGPLLLVEGCGMPSATASELSRLRPSSITVVGGGAAVCDGVLDHARAITGVQPGRVAGADRFETAAALSRAHWGSGSPVVVLASAAGFADSLSGGALGSSQEAPLLLSGTCTLPQTTASELTRLRPANVLVMGGQGAICDDVLAQVAGVTGAAVTRVSGADRFSTAAAAGALGWPSAGTVFVASGAGFADGLAAGAAAAVAGAPLLLVPSCGAVPTAVTDALLRLSPDHVVAVGGEAAICAETLSQL
ncbi:MAG TPA: S8 family serine peptidase [Acidimicrobiales bacterium]|nr:S8 family serine peptidase [Acidimicrobiales bacterium]